MLPDGGSHEALTAIWSSSIDEYISILKQQSLIQTKQLENDITWYSTLPFIQLYAQFQLQDEDKKEFQSKACEYFGTLCEKAFNIL